ncbi:MAG TPA: Flp family type IVb pilin [Acetobacteraceae bacterium]|nr:Flp family type IVb pilin [Acetobacteraceae bacterium]
MVATVVHPLPRRRLLAVRNNQQMRELCVVLREFGVPEAKPRLYVFRGFLHGRFCGMQVAVELVGKRSFEATPERGSLMYGWHAGWRELLRDERGVTALEYGLIAAAIMAVIVTTVISFGNSIEVDLYQNVAAKL